MALVILDFSLPNPILDRYLIANLEHGILDLLEAEHCLFYIGPFFS